MQVFLSTPSNIELPPDLVVIARVVAVAVVKSIGVSIYTVIDCRLEQPAKAEGPMFVIVFGINTLKMFR